MTEGMVRYEHGIDSLEKMGHYIATSGLFGVKSPVQAVALMLIAQAEGRHPASAAQDYNIIQNRPALKADSMLARFQQAGGKVEWEEYTDQRVAGLFSHPQSPKPVLVDWDMTRAKTAGLGAKDNWKHYPRAMLRARVISEGVRTVYPAVLGGMYTPEEVMDFEPLPTNGTTVEAPVSSSVPPLTPKPADTGAPEDPRVEVGRLLLEMAGGDKEEAANLLEVLTTFTNDKGTEIRGKRSLHRDEMSDKYVKATLGKAREQHTKWLAAMDAPPPEDDIPFDWNEDFGVRPDGA